MNLHHPVHQHSPRSNDSRLTLPSISIMDDFLPKRSWVPPTTTTTSSPPTLIKSLPTPPQPDQWKSPPYNNRNELSRDSSYTYYNKTSPLLFSNTITQKDETSPESPKQPYKSGYFQYTSKAYHSNTASSPSSSYSNSTYTPNRVDSDIEEVVRQCNTLCDNMIQNKSQFMIQQPSHHNNDSTTRPLLDDMIGRANEVLNALLRLRKHQLASEQQQQQQQQQQIRSSLNNNDPYSSTEHNNHHPNTWRMGSPSSSSLVNNNNNNITTTSNIRRKRGKRPAFQGRCHSCNISSTPEWRRGPDGARTLCNACGLHYAKLSRKQQENRGMSNTSILNTRRSSNHSGHSFGSNKLTSPPPSDDIILDRSPTG